MLTVNRKLMSEITRSLSAVIGGFIGSLAFAPGNIPFALLPAFATLIFLASKATIFRAAWYGWLWGTALTGASFFWLREIHPGIPFLLAVILGIPYSMWGALIPIFNMSKTYPGSCGKQILCVAGLAGGYVLLCEYSRNFILPWNYLASTLWRTPQLLGLLPYAGTFILSFFIAMLCIGAGLVFVGKKYLFFLLILGGIIFVFAAGEFFRPEFSYKEATEYRFALIQGDISQRRNASQAEADEALNIYVELSRLSLSQKADFTIWPETAIPYAVRGSGKFSERYRNELSQLIADSQRDFIIGSLDYRITSDRSVSSVNSAMLFDRRGVLAGTFDKIHLVPFGEYIPLRRFLPKALIRLLDMGRALSPGDNNAPLATENGLRAGMMICFEDVFPDIPRESIQRGANILLTITNDAWFPRSSEPEQHLANAVMRAVENNLYFIRVGNNGGSCVIDPYGKIEQVLQVPGTSREEIRRGRGWNVVKAYAPNKPRLTFYAKNGNWIIGLILAIFIGSFYYLKIQTRKKSKEVPYDQK